MAILPKLVGFEIYRDIERQIRTAEELTHDLRIRRAQFLADCNTACGMSYADIADGTGLSRSRIQQLVERGRAGT